MSDIGIHAQYCDVQIIFTWVGICWVPCFVHVFFPPFSSGLEFNTTRSYSIHTRSSIGLNFLSGVPGDEIYFQKSRRYIKFTRDPRHSPIRLSRQNSRPAKTFSTHQSKSRKININFCISLDGMTSGPVILRILLELNLEHFWPLRLFARLHIFRNRFRPVLMLTACHGASLRKDWILKSERIRKRIWPFFTWCVKEKPEKNPLPEQILRFLRRKMI